VREPVYTSPGVYSPSKSVTGTLSATQSASDIGISASYVYVSQGANVSFPVTARVISKGSPRNNIRVNFSRVGGSGELQSRQRYHRCEMSMPASRFQQRTSLARCRGWLASLRGIFHVGYLCESGSAVAAGVATGCGRRAGFRRGRRLARGGVGCRFGGFAAQRDGASVNFLLLFCAVAVLFRGSAVETRILGILYGLQSRYQLNGSYGHRREIAARVANSTFCIGVVQGALAATSFRGVSNPYRRQLHG